MKKLDTSTLFEFAKQFCIEQSRINHVELLGVTDGKAVGTYVEHLFQTALQWRLQYGRIIALHNTVDGIENYDA